MALIKFEDSPSTNTPLNANNLNNNFDSVNPVGSILITSTNTNPASELGGTWELIDKEFTPFATYKSNSEYITLSENISNVYFGFTRSGHTITFQMQYTNLVELSNDNVDLATINFEEIGISRIIQTIRFLADNDGTNSVIIQNISGTSGLLQSRGVINNNGNKISANNISHFSVTVNVPQGYMLDAKCNKFYWKRTA